MTKKTIMTEKHPKKTGYYILCIVATLIGIGFICADTIPVLAGETDTALVKTIRSGAEIDYPPFSFTDENGKADGFSVILMRAALAAMRRDVTFRTGPWDEVRNWLEHAEIDALPLVGRTPEREALFDFTVPYMSLYGAIVVRNNETGLRDLDDLRGRRVAVMKGDNAEEFLRREDRGIEIHTRPTIEIALQELSEGRYDAVIAQRLVALRLIQKTGLTDLRVMDRPIEGFKQDFCFAVKEGDRETLALLNEGLAIVIADGTYRHLHSKWFAAMQLPSDRQIVVGGDRNFPPYEFLDENGHPTGYNVDLTRAIANEMGLNIDIRLGRWTERLEALENGRIDVMQGMFYSPDRDLKFDFSQPHAASHYVAVVRKGNGPAPESAADLSGKRIVVEQGDISHDFAVANGLEKQVVAVSDQEVALRELRDGKHDCALVSLITAHYLIDKHSWSNLVPGRKTIFVSEYCYASAKDQKALLAQFSEGLKALENSGEYKQIHDKWFGIYKDMSTSLIDALRYSAIVVIPLLLIIILALTWSWSLRRQVAEKTKALQESLDRFKYFFEASNVGKSITLPTGEISANKAFSEFLGYSHDELKDKKWQDLTPAEDIEKIDKILGPLLTGQKKADRFEKRYVHKNGTLLWADLSVATRHDAKRNPLYFMTTIVDITARKQAEDALRNSEEFKRAMIDCSPVALYTVDLDGNVLSWNTSAERIFGWRAEEIIGKPLPIVPADKREEFDALRRQVLENGGFLGKELIRLRNDGTLFPVSLSVAPIRNDRDQVVGILGAVEDLTERKFNESRLKWNLQRNALLSETAARLLQSDDPRALVDDLCRKVLEVIDCHVFFNFLEDSQQGKLHLNAFAGVSEEEAQKIEWLKHGAAVCGCVAQSQKPMVCENIQDRDDPLTDLVKSYGIQAYCCHPLMTQGRLIGTLSFGRRATSRFEPDEIDLMSSITNLVAVAMNRIETEHKLRDSESRFKMFAELAPLGIVISDNQEKTLYANPRFTELFGYTMEDMPSGEQWWELAYPDISLRNIIREEWQKAVEKARRSLSEIKPMECPVTCKNGSVRYIEFRMATREALNIVVFTDITERKKIEAEHEKLQSHLLQAQKMESVGRLAGGVAHDYNNMLSVIIGYAQMCIAQTNPEDNLHADLKEILTAAERSTDITRQLLAFARKQTINPKVLDLNEMVESMLKMIRRLIGEDVDLSWKPRSGLWEVKMDPSQLDQILVNLCVNARDAISNVGKITIETDKVRFDEDYCAVHAGFIPGEYVLLAVSDDGDGMDMETLEKIFEPFYTTKEVGKGTGLGLSVIYGIIKQNNGFINVYSEKGNGSTLKIYIPRNLEGIDDETESKSLEPVTGRGETILLVEDEFSLMVLAKRMLENLGYIVLGASKPGEAMELVEKHAGKIHLLLTDVVMPNMNGRDLANQITALYPDMKLLFMSGYTANVIAHQGILDKGVHFIQKPLSKNELAAKVRKVLDTE